MLTAAPISWGPLPLALPVTSAVGSPVAPTSPTTTSLSPAQLAGETAIGQSINAFALDLYASLQSQQGGSGNTVFSPMSISAALAMAYAGANGQTATQMASVLHFSGAADDVEQDFGTLLSDLNAAGQGGNYTLSVADALWGQQGMQILAPFLQTMQSDFSGDLQQVDFVNNPTGAVQTINSWVSQQTDGLIQQLLTPSDINDLTRLILTNAVYFNGSWATAFNVANTQNAPFTLDSGNQVQVPIMNNTSTFGYMDSDGFQVLDMPYTGGRLSMDVILPDQGYTAAGLNVSQLPADLTSWLAGLQNQQVAVSLPKFNITTQFDLGDQLQALGMTDAFSNTADFSGITDPTVTQLKISDVVHQATISVGETGTVAAAATAVSMVFCSCVTEPIQPIVFDANHPFLFLIRDDQSGAVLFMGQETDPSLSTGGPSAPPVGTAPQSPGSTTTPPVSPWRYVPEAPRLNAPAGDWAGSPSRRAREPAGPPCRGVRFHNAACHPGKYEPGRCGAGRAGDEQPGAGEPRSGEPRRRKHCPVECCRQRCLGQHASDRHTRQCTGKHGIAANDHVRRQLRLRSLSIRGDRRGGFTIRSD